MGNFFLNLFTMIVFFILLFSKRVKEVSYKFLNGEINNLDSSDFDSNDDQIDSLLNDLGAEQSDSQTNLVISVLTIHQTSRDDSLVYVCKATNEFGWAEYRIQLIVKGWWCYADVFMEGERPCN